MPVSWTVIFRGVILLALGAHAFYIYSIARGMSETVGFRPSTVLVSAFVAAAMMIPFVWVYWAADLPRMYVRHIVPGRRWKRGQCPTCGYDLRGHGDHGRDARATGCPECGSAIAPPPPFAFGWATVRRFFALVVAALLIGCVAAESLVLADEAAFRREATLRESQRATGPYSRPRKWPNGACSLVYSPESGVSAVD